MDKGRRVKRIFENKPVESRIKKRPRLRWLEKVEEDLREMKVKRWRQKAVDREELVSIIFRAQGPQRAVGSSSK